MMHKRSLSLALALYLPARSLWTAPVWVMWAVWSCGIGSTWLRTV